MKFPAPQLACALLVGVVAAMPCKADSFASSASSAGSKVSGSLSDSVSSPSSASKNDVAEGDYRIVEIAAAERPDTVRLHMQHVARKGDDGLLYLTLPRHALGDRASPLGDVVGVRQRPYGYEFAWADTRVAFFLALADEWHRDLEARPL